jgi:hypothetical protein
MRTISKNRVVDYSTGWCSDEYKCMDCGANGVKLYRIAACSCIELRCIDCVGKESSVDVSDADEHGKVWSDMFGIRTDQIGGMLPAIPGEFKVSYGESTVLHATWCQYTCVPQAGIDWWYTLPLRKGQGESNGKYYRK